MRQTPLLIISCNGSVVSCTLALFLSGYVIQQRTLRELQEAIRPRAPRPAAKQHLPDKFKSRIAELEDGSFVFLESEAEEEARLQKEAYVHVKQSTKESLDQPAAETSPSDSSPNRPKKGTPTARQLAILEEITLKVEQKKWAVENPDPLALNRVPINAAQRRQLIREEIQRLATSNQLVYMHKSRW